MRVGVGDRLGDGFVCVLVRVPVPVLVQLGRLQEAAHRMPLGGNEPHLDGRALRHVGHLVVDWIWKLGTAGRFTGYPLMRSADSVRRPQLTLNEVYFAGTLSLIIIVVSGMFVGLVLRFWDLGAKAFHHGE